MTDLTWKERMLTSYGAFVCLQRDKNFKTVTSGSLTASDAL